jgi:hypothetical protein
MLAVDLRSLVGRMNDVCRRSLEAAAGLTLSRSHYNVEIEHWLLQLLERPDGDIAAILRHYEIDPARLSADLTRLLDSFKTGNSRAPALSPHVVTLAREAWVIASLDGGASRIRSGHVLAALLADDSLAPSAREASAQLARIPGDALRKDLAQIVSGSAEEVVGEVALVLEVQQLWTVDRPRIAEDLGEQGSELVIAAGLDDHLDAREVRAGLRDEAGHLGIDVLGDANQVVARARVRIDGDIDVGGILSNEIRQGVDHVDTARFRELGGPDLDAVGGGVGDERDAVAVVDQPPG